MSDLFKFETPKTVFLIEKVSNGHWLGTDVDNINAAPFFTNDPLIATEYFKKEDAEQELKSNETIRGMSLVVTEHQF